MMNVEDKFIKIGVEYYLQDNSLKETSNFLKVKYNFPRCQEWWRRKIKKLGHVRSSRDGVKISNRRHINTQRIIDMYKKHKSIRLLSRKTNASRSTIKKILQENNIKILTKDEAIHFSSLKYPKIPFSGTDQEKAYLYGFVFGDVHVFKRSKFTLRAITHSTHKTFAELFVALFSKYGYVRCKLNKYNEWALAKDLDYNSFCFLEERKIDRLPNWINDNIFLYFLAGFIDSDGTVMIRKSGKYFQYIIRFFGQEKNILSQMKYLLNA